MLYKRIIQITALAISSAAIAFSNIDFATAQGLPLTTQPMGNAQSVMIPDFTQISFENLPKIQVTAQLQQQLSQLLSPSALTNLAIGSYVSPDRYLTVGSLQSLGLEQMSLQAIASRAGVSLSNVSLGQLGELTSQQTINSLLQSLPELRDRSLSQVQPFLDLVTQKSGSANLNRLSGEISGMTVGQLVNAFPELGNLSLSSLGDRLNSYSLESISGFAQLPLSNIQGASGVVLSDLNATGLGKLSLSQFPNAPALLPNVRFGMVDIALGNREKNRINSISGGVTEAGFQAVGCDGNNDCPHIEVTDFAGGYYNGKQWMTASQQVPDGYGFLGGLFGNRGPAGNHPFGDAFRVTIESLDEASGTITLGLRFRWCQRSWFVDLGCTPYITPPLPLVVLHEKSAIPYAVPINAAVNAPISSSKPFSQ
ncbi:hypothetical protein VB774_19995 [Pseudanabaena galeata UHCC 0370]|uniref:Uncharacterized protein n=1 Tax=Pseudanabaena galeata UHCC 0370 TaxID=3110310 RepID=A0ABU5TNQ6_9CYAN|nr:hypothetical protein [Pseudanabaena galeata]MEA5479915.1 hypothetical protein [Pseudanabaena galeata UHCC 0370]